MKLLIKYRDEVGYVLEEVDEYGINFVGDIAYFNDKRIPTNQIEQIGLE